MSRINYALPRRYRFWARPCPPAMGEGGGQGFLDNRVRDTYNDFTMKLPRQNLVLRPTRHGLLFITILAAMLAGSVNYNNNAGFILVFLLGGMALISLVHSYRNLTDLDIGFAAAPPVFAGQPAAFLIRIRAGQRERAAITFSLPGGGDRTETLEPGEEKTVPVTAPARERGLFSPKTLFVSSVFPFGLFRIQTRIPTDMACLVYPRPVSGDFRMTGGGDGMDGTVDTRDRGPDDFQGLALYQPGHDVNRIAWKAVSRGQGIFIKDFTARADRLRIFDFNAFSSTDTEFRLSRLCDLILKAHGRHIRFGLKLPGKMLDPSSGNTHQKRCLRALALFGSEPAGQ